MEEVKPGEESADEEEEEEKPVAKKLTKKAFGKKKAEGTRTL